MPLRPSHDESIAASFCATYRASTQPVSLLVPVPLPHTSSEPLNVVLFAASWQARFVMDGSFMLNVLPDCVVLIVTEPLIQPVPVPCITCSVVWSRAPVEASTSTLSRLAPSAPVPDSVVS